MNVFVLQSLTNELTFFCFPFIIQSKGSKTFLCYKLVFMLYMVTFDAFSVCHSHSLSVIFFVIVLENKVRLREFSCIRNYFKKQILTYRNQDILDRSFFFAKLKLILNFVMQWNSKFEKNLIWKKRFDIE